MKILDKSIDKTCPPSDKKINMIAYVGSIVATSILALYFVISGIVIVFLDIIPFSLFAYGVFFVEIILTGGGLVLCVTQLIRNRYHRIVLTTTMYLINLAIFLLYIFAVFFKTGHILVPFIYHIGG